MSKEVNKKLLGDRIKKLRQKNKIKIKDLSQALGISESALYMVETGRRGISIEVAKKLADIFHVSIDYLLGNVDDPNPNLLKDIIDKLIGEGLEKEKIHLRPIPVYDGAHAGDVGIFPDNLTPEEFVTIPKNSPGKYGVIVHGDSMRPSINDGDIVVIEPDQEVLNGQKAVVFVDGGLMVKKVFRNDGSTILASDNPDYPPIVIKKAEEPAYILGKVVWILKKEP